MNGTIIYLFGFAGCGNLTIAKAIQGRFDCILVDNHRINNVIFSLVDPDGRKRLPERVWKNVSQVRAAVFDTIRHLSKPGRSFIFTNELIEGDEGSERVFLEIAALAQERNATFLPVRIIVSAEELSRRVASPSRVEMFKETDAQAAWTKVREMEVLRPRDMPYLDLDVTFLTAEEAAEQILVEVAKQERKQKRSMHCE